MVQKGIIVQKGEKEDDHAKVTVQKYYSAYYRIVI